MTPMWLAAAFWLGLHLIVAGPLRARLVAMLGERWFFGVFSLLSVAGVGFFIVAYRMAPYVPLWPTLPALGWLVFLLVFLGVLLAVLGVGPKNPTDTHAPSLIGGKLPVYGITRVTRHPRLCGISLWATAHLMVNGHLAALLMFGSLLFTALNGMVSIDRKRRRALGPVWDAFEAQTSRLPFAAILAGRTRFEPAEFRLWQFVLAAALFAGVIWVHGIVGPSPLFILQ
jgi:uncharacterized membrane protein